MINKKGFKKTFLMLSLLLASTTLTACGGTKSEMNAPGDSKETFQIRIGSGYPVEGAPWTKVVKEYYIPEVNKALENTKYKIDWVESYGGTTAKPGEELEAVQNKLLDMAFVVSPLEPSALKVSNIGYNVPFSSSNPEIFTKATYAIFDKYPELSKEYEEANQKLLGLGVTESYELITNFPVDSVEDLKNKKIAAVGSNLNWIKPIGVVPVQSNLTEAYQSLQSGVYDGWVMYSGSVKGFKLHEQAKYFTRVGFGCAIIGGLTINKNTWDNFPEEVQSILGQTGKTYSDALTKEIEKQVNENMELLQKEGAIISDLTEGERVKWTEMVQSVPSDYAKRLEEAGLPGRSMVKDFIQAQIDAGHQFPLSYTIE